jgi:hypothetical protein
VATSLFDGQSPVIELDGKRIALLPVDPVANSHRRRPPRRPVPERAAGPVDFDPGRTLTLPQTPAVESPEEVDDDTVF